MTPRPKPIVCLECGEQCQTGKRISQTNLRYMRCDSCGVTWKANVLIATQSEKYRCLKFSDPGSNENNKSQTEFDDMILQDGNSLKNGRGESVQLLRMDILADAIDHDPRTLKRWIKSGSLPIPHCVNGDPAWSYKELAMFIVKYPDRVSHLVAELFTDGHGGVRSFPTLPGDKEGVPIGTPSTEN